MRLSRAEAIEWRRELAQLVGEMREIIDEGEDDGMHVSPAADRVAGSCVRIVCVVCGGRDSPGYAASQRVRKRIEEGFGWMKAVAGLHRPKLRGVDRVGWAFTFAAAYNLVRLPKLLAAPA